MSKRKYLGGLAMPVAVFLATSVSAYAQTAPADGASKDSGEIIVTARKREESLISVPVVETVVTPKQLDAQQVVSLADLTQLAPGLMLGNTVLSIGPQVSLRGVGTTSFDPGIDQSVSLNVDGLSMGQGLAFASGMFDLGQVEVLEGPQALFFGKSSPGGVISLRTADPTDKLEVKGTAGYEVEAHTRRFEAIVSGPLTDTLKVRLAGMYSKSDGFYYNAAVVPAGATFTAAPGVNVPVSATGGVTPLYNRMDRSENYQLRGTVLWNPAPNFEARLKMNVVHDMAITPENFRLTGCPDGVGGVPAYGNVPFINPADQCNGGRTGYIVYYNPANFPGVLNNGVPFVESAQQYATLELTWHPRSDLTVTSLSSYYHLHSSSLLNTSQTGYAGPLLAAQNPNFRRYDFTQELRVNSDFTGPLNFTLGGFYQNGKVRDLVQLVGNSFFIPATTLAPLQDGLNQFNINTYSLYGQLRYKITPQLELAAGARWTDETRTEDPILYTSLTEFGLLGSPGVPAAPGAFYPAMPTPRIHSSPVTPEVTLTYKPSTDLTIFAAYKQGAKSGSFSIATPPTYTPCNTAVNPGCNPATPWLDNSFGDEKVKGGEIGIKGRTADRQVHFSLSAYLYNYKGLQVGAIEPTVGSLPVIRTVNAGSGRVYGIEGSIKYQPAAIKGLSLDGSVNWTHARFLTLNNAPCYGGQTFAGGCTQEYNASTGLYFAQNLNGYPFVRAPDWQANFGFEYEHELGKALKWRLTSSNHYSSDYYTGLGARADYIQSAFVKFDLSAAIADAHDRWEVAVIGKNIGNKLTTSNCAASNFQNGLLGGEITGSPTNAAGPAGIDEQGCYMDPGREIWIRLTIRPFG